MELEAAWKSNASVISLPSGSGTPGLAGTVIEQGVETNITPLQKDVIVEVYSNDSFSNNSHSSNDDKTK